MMNDDLPADIYKKPEPVKKVIARPLSVINYASSTNRSRSRQVMKNDST